MDQFDEAVAAAVAELSRKPPSEIRPEARLEADLGIDSLEFTTLVRAVEERFDTMIDDKAIAEVQTVAELAAAFRQWLAPQTE